VKNININISPEKQKEGVPREWLAYSPESLIRHYGSPSRVDFFLGRGGSRTPYGMDIYFDSMDLIVGYSNFDLGAKLQVCPLSDQMWSVQVWMGDSFQNPFLPGVPLEQATSMKMDEFTKLMTGNPSTACFALNPEMFP
jgi:hypothetical protein